MDLLEVGIVGTEVDRAAGQLPAVTGLELVDALAQLLEFGDPGVSAVSRRVQQPRQVRTNGFLRSPEVDGVVASSRISARVSPSARRVPITPTHHRAVSSNNR